jgi:hypothetical protein
MTFFWGAVGGAAGYTVLYVIPWGVALARGRLAVEDASVSKAVGAALVFVGLLFLGGVAGIIAGGDARSGIVAGIGAQGLVKALTTGP